MSVKTVLLAFGLIFVCAGPLYDAATIKFIETSLSFGEINHGQVADLQFEFSNTGDSPLVIKQVHSTCGCAVPKLEKMEYLPGEKGVIPVRFFSKGYQGRVIKTLSVTSNDEKNPQLRLQITGVVNLTDFADIQVAPRHLKFGKQSLGKPARQQLTISNPGNQDLRISQVSHSPDIYLIFPKSILTPGERVSVDVVYNPSRTGTFSTNILLTTNALGKGQEMIRVDVEVSER